MSHKENLCIYKMIHPYLMNKKGKPQKKSSDHEDVGAI